MKKILFVVAMVLAMALPLFAQGPFNDVPTDHWAYDAINKLQTDGILIGYPDGTFGGKRAITRYEFAVALSRLPLGGATGNFVTKDELNSTLSDYAKKSDIPDISKLASKADVDAMSKLVNEFKDELASLGVDVDSMKRDVAALSARVDAVEAEQKRVRFTGDVNVFADATSSYQNTTVDLDNRTTTAGAGGKNTLGRTTGVVTDFDLNLVGRVSCNTTANATINYGNYLNYIAFVDDYVGGQRPTTKNTSNTLNNQDTLSDGFFPYYLYIESTLSKGALTVGRFPIQFTPYTLKKIDVDSYTNIIKTDDGNYPMDGAKLGYNFGGVDVTLFAAKNDENDYLANGLTGQPTAGLFDSVSVANPNGTAKAGYTFAGGHAVGGLTNPITQSAGVRVQAGTPWKGNIGATYYQAWSANSFYAGADQSDYDQARVYGFDVTVPFSSFSFAGTWNQSDTLARDGASASNVTDDNDAWDTKLAANFGKLGVNAGYKQIGKNYAAAGSWDKLGRWTNPTDIKGTYLGLTYPINNAIKVVVNGEYLKLIDNVNTNANIFGQSGDKILTAQGGVQWGLSKTNNLDLGVQWVKYSPQTAGKADATEAYYNVGWAHQVGANAGLKIGYQFINYDDGNTASGPYTSDYRGGEGVVQFGVSF